MKNLALPMFSLLCCQNTQACAEIAGKYITVSESEWSYELTISNQTATLRYTDHEHTDREEVVETEKIENGQCKKLNGKYLLVFSNNNYPLKYHKELSHESFGREGSSPGVTVKNLIPKTSLEFWLEGTVK